MLRHRLAGLRTFMRAAPALIAIVTICLTGSAIRTGAYAQDTAPVTAEGAAALARALNAGLGKWFPEMASSPSYSWDGEVNVTPGETAYDATLPTLMIVPRDSGAWVLDGLRLRLVPMADGTYRVSARFPEQMPYIEPDGKISRSVTIGSQTFQGRWHPEADSLTELTATFGDLVLEGQQSPLSAHIGTIDVFTQLTRDATGRWGGPSTARIDGFRLRGPGDAEVFSLDTLAFEGEINGLDLKRQASLAGSDGSASLEDRLNALRSLLDGASGILTLTGLTANAPAEQTAFGLEALTAEIVLEGLVGNASTVSIGYRHEGLVLDPPATGEDFLPKTVAFHLTALDLPNAALWGALDRFRARSAANVGPAATVSFLQEILRSLTATGSEFRFDQFIIDTPSTTSSVEGHLRFNPTALLGATAEFDIGIRGLDQALATLQPRPGESLASETQDVLALLGLLQVMGLPGQDDDGRPTRTYNIELRSNGSATLNGADLGSLLRSFQR